MKAIFVSARSASTRLPSKALMKVGDKTTVGFLIDCLKDTKMASEIILCTTKNKEDDALCEVAASHGVKYFRGSSEDKILRWKNACEEYKVDFFVNVDGDDLFFDYNLADLVFQQNEKEPADFIDGQGFYNDVYGISYKGLEKVCATKNSDQTEFIKTYFEACEDVLTIEKLHNVPEIYNKKDVRMTLDYEEDFLFFQTIIKHFLSENRQPLFKDIINYIEKNQHLKQINWFRESEWKSNQKKMIQQAKN